MNSIRNDQYKRVKQGLSWALFVFFSQIPFVFWYGQGGPTLHPIVVMLPLVGIINFYVEKRDLEGLGLRIIQPRWSLIVALIYVGFSILGKIIVLKMEETPFQLQAIKAKLVWELVLSFLIGVFIIALWEEIINRGFIQTRLQEAWGFWGVIVTTLLFAAMHIPSALLEYDHDLVKVAIRFSQAGLAGFAFGYVYWRTKSVVTTIAIHGLNNFAITGILPILTGIDVQQVTFNQPVLQIAWLVGQVGVIVFFSQFFFKQTGK